MRPYVDYVVRGQGETPLSNLLEQSIDPAHAISRRSPDCPGSMQGRPCTTRDSRRSCGPSPRTGCLTSWSATRADTSGAPTSAAEPCCTRRPWAVASDARSAAWRRCSAARPRCRRSSDSSRTSVSARPVRRRRRAVLRPQFLRPRGRHDSAARGARARSQLQLVVLCARRRDAGSVRSRVVAGAKKQVAHGIHRCGVTQRQPAARPAQGHAIAPDAGGSRTLHGATGSFRSCLSWWLRRRTRRAKPSGRSNSSARSSARIPATEIIVYVYTPLPASSLPANARARESALPLLDVEGNPVIFPRTPDEWTERRWVDYSCHADAPWVSPRLRRRIRDFVTVLGCRFPTVQDVRYPGWTKTSLSALAAWRYRYRRYDRPWELMLSRRLIRLADPRATSL